MRDEYDFSKGECGKFFNPNAKKNLPVYLEAEVLDYFAEKAKANGVFKQRLKALEAKVAEEGLVLTESQVQAFERKKHDDEACGEIDTAHPGYLGSQDTFYVGTFKGVGRVCSAQLNQDTFLKEFSYSIGDISSLEV